MFQLQVVEASSGPRTRGFVSPVVDTLMIGGASLLFFFLAKTLFGNDRPSNEASWFVFNLSFFVNFPHFLSSYHMLYGDFRRELFRRPRYFVAGILVPAALVGILAYAFVNRQTGFLGVLANTMYFIVGWHYVKQVFGGIIVSNAAQKIFYSREERWTLKGS